MDSVNFFNIYFLNIDLRFKIAAYIVTYDGYYTANIRYNIIKEAAKITVNIEPRPVLLSDFDVVEVIFIIIIKFNLWVVDFWQ